MNPKRLEREIEKEALAMSNAVIQEIKRDLRPRLKGKRIDKAASLRVYERFLRERHNKSLRMVIRKLALKRGYSDRTATLSLRLPSKKGGRRGR